MDGVRAFSDESSAVFEGLDGSSVLVHEINLFQRKTLGLGQRSVSSSEEHYGRQRTSGMHRKVKMIQQKQVEPQMKNTFDSRPAEPGCLLTR
jgi:hypothetical protein